MKSIQYGTAKIAYIVTGKGPDIVLLHGFTESQSIWRYFVSELSASFRVTTIDLPGHGQSDCLGNVHSMELLADVVNRVLETVGVTQCLMVGHSMGGYAALSFAEQHPQKLVGLCIFHSHCFADSSQDKENRDKTIKFVQLDKISFISNFIPALFPEEVQRKFAQAIDALVKEASSMTKEGIIAALEGMKNRKDQTALLESLSIPVLFIVGLKDSKAPLDRIWEMISLPPHSESLILKDVGHMGYIEEREKTLQAIKHFGLRAFSQIQP